MILLPARIVAFCAVLATLLVFYIYTVPAESMTYYLRMGVDPWGRVALGVIELSAAVLLLLPRLFIYGAFLSSATMLTGIINGFRLSSLNHAFENTNSSLLLLSALIALSAAFYILLQFGRSLFASRDTHMC
ncbi:hypothetical protein ABDK00_008195 [Niabella insulamsoli]|uniref:hypothetical protein n=1 Tax=Niabella insulamsoli TaxID=3144874 RepID=UPI0031FC6BA6